MRSIMSVGPVAVAIFFLVAVVSLRAQDEYVLPELEEEALVRLLFNAKEYSVERGGRWIPDFEESLIFNLSENNFCYTNLDTVMMVPLESDEGEDLSLALLVFTTYGYVGGERSDCHVCAPDISLALYEEVENGWNLRAFRKHVMQLGTFGARGDLSVVQVGEGLYALDMEASYTGQGYTEGASWLISMSLYSELEEIFSLPTYAYGPAGCEEECGSEWCENFRNVEKELTFVPNIYADSDYPEFYNMLVTVTERTCEGEETSRTERYVFNGFRYERSCEQ